MNFVKTFNEIEDQMQEGWKFQEIESQREMTKMS